MKCAWWSDPDPTVLVIHDYRYELAHAGGVDRHDAARLTDGAGLADVLRTHASSDSQASSLYVLAAGVGDRAERALRLAMRAGFPSAALCPTLAPRPALSADPQRVDVADLPELHFQLETVRGIDAGELRALIERSRNELRFCLAAFPVTAPVPLLAHVLLAGSAIPLAVHVESPASDSLGHCIANAHRRWDYPLPRGVGVLTVRYDPPR